MSDYSFIDEVLFTLTDQSAWDITGITQEQYNILSAQLEVDRAEAKQQLIKGFEKLMLEVEKKAYRRGYAAGNATKNYRHSKMPPTQYKELKEDVIREILSLAALESMLSKSKGSGNE